MQRTLTSRRSSSTISGSKSTSSCSLLLPSSDSDSASSVVSCAVAGPAADAPATRLRFAARPCKMQQVAWRMSVPNLRLRRVGAEDDPGACSYIAPRLMALPHRHLQRHRRRRRLGHATAETAAAFGQVALPMCSYVCSP